MPTDTERLDWLERQNSCPGLINDDAGRWAVSTSGMQNMPDPDKATDITTSFFVEAKDWRPSVREAIDAAIEAEKTGD